MLIFSSFLMFLIWGWTYDPGHSAADNMVDDVVAGFKNGADGKAAQDTVKVVGGAVQFSADDSFTGKIELTDSLLSTGVTLDEAVRMALPEEEVGSVKYTLLLQLMKLKGVEQAVIVRYFVGNLSFVILALQPVIALLLWLLYVRHRKTWYYVRHMVFTLYFHAWLLVLMTLLLLIEAMSDSFTSSWFFLGLGFLYLLLAIRYFYKQSWGKSVLKSVLLSAVYCGFVGPLFAVLSFLVSFYFF